MVRQASDDDFIYGRPGPGGFPRCRTVSSGAEQRQRNRHDPYKGGPRRDPCAERPFHHAHFNASIMESANLMVADLHESNFIHTNLAYANLQEANLRDAT